MALSLRSITSFFLGGSFFNIERWSKDLGLVVSDGRGLCGIKHQAFGCKYQLESCGKSYRIGDAVSIYAVKDKNIVIEGHRFSHGVFTQLLECSIRSHLRVIHYSEYTYRRIFWNDILNNLTHVSLELMLRKEDQE